MKKNGLIALIMLITVSSCEMVLEVDVPREKTKLVANCIFNTDSTWHVSVFESRYILDDYNFRSVENAQVKIVTETNEEVILSHTQNGEYTSTSRPELNQHYTLEISANGFESISSVAFVPELVPVTSVLVDSASVVYDESGSASLPIEVTFNGPGNRSNNYEAKLFQEIEREYYRWDTQELVKDTFLRLTPLVIENSAKDARTSIFSDVLFNGKQYTLKSKIRISTSEGSGYRLLKATVILINTSEEYFNYLNSSNLQKNTDGDLFAQPVQVYSNIKNGLGIFGGYTASSFVLKE